MSVIGGYVYRGSDVPDLSGRYVFGDWSTGIETADGTLFVAEQDDSGDYAMQELAITGRDEDRLGEFLLSFGQDLDGELYVLTSMTAGPTGTTGSVYRMVAP